MGLVEVEAIAKAFPAHRGAREMLRHPLRRPSHVVLRSVDLVLEGGEIVGILGANGAGKTTLLKVIAALVRPDEGRVRVAGWDVDSHPRQARAHVAYCFNEERSFYWRLTGRQNLAFFAALQDISGASFKRRAAELAEKLAIGEYLDQPFSRLSSGVRQRFSLARALLSSPRVLLLDEPTKSIDPAEARRIWRLVAEELAYEQNMAVILVTHQLEEAAALCDRIAVLEGGCLRTDMTMPELRRPTRGLDALTLLVDGLSQQEVVRLRQLDCVSELQLTERNGEQELEVWCENGDVALRELASAAASAGVQIRGLSRSPRASADATGLPGQTNGHTH